MDGWDNRPVYNEQAMGLQGTIGLIAICAALIIFFPWLALPIFIVWLLNMLAKASEAHDRWETRRRERPNDSPELLSGPFEATPPEEVF